jgi:hypothetical protein
MERESRKRSSSAGSEKWRDLVLEREKWKEIFRQAKAHGGLHANRRRKEEDDPHFISLLVTALELRFPHTTCILLSRPFIIHS